MDTSIKVSDKQAHIGDLADIAKGVVIATITGLAVVAVIFSPTINYCGG